jgi:hypothetical protein
LPNRGSVAAQLLVLGLTQEATVLVVQGAVALVSGAVGGWLARRPGFLVWQERFTGLVIIGLDIRLLLGTKRQLPRIYDAGPSLGVERQRSCDCREGGGSSARDPFGPGLLADVAAQHSLTVGCDILC